MRILAYTHSFDRSGAPIILFRLLRALARRHTVHVLDVGSRDRSLAEAYRACGIELVGSVALRDYDVGLFNTLLASRKIIEAGDLPVLWWIHEPAFGPDLLANPRHETDPAAFRAAKAIVFPTEWQARSLYAPFLGDRADWICIPYGIEPHGTAPGDRAAACPFVREDGKLYLVQLGALCHRKGHDVTAAALESLGDRGIVWICVGDDAAFPAFSAGLKRTAADLRCVGVQDEAGVAAYLRHADALVCPTRDDLISLSILEALSQGRCVIASDYGPIPETVVDGETGLLAPVGDAAALAGAIARVRRDPDLAARLGAAGQAVQREKHGFARHVALMEAALDSIAR